MTFLVFLRIFLRGGEEVNTYLIAVERYNIGGLIGLIGGLIGLIGGLIG